MKKIDVPIDIWVIIITCIFTILILSITPHVHASGYISYDDSTTFNGSTYYLYDLPPRYTSDGANRVRAIFYKGDGSYSNYVDKQIQNNAWVGTTFQSNLQYNNNNLFTLVSNPISYGIMPASAYNFSNQAYLSLIFSPGNATTTTDDQFYNPNTYKSDGYYDFDFDIYQVTSRNDWTNNWQVKYNNQGNYCTNNNGYEYGGDRYYTNCFVSRFSGSYDSGSPTYTKTTYHVKHGQFDPGNELEGDVSNTIKATNNPGYYYSYIYSMDSPFMVNSNSDPGTRFEFYISTPYNIKYYSQEQRLFINGDRITNTSEINYSNSNTCYDSDCQDNAQYEQNLFYQLFNIDVINLHGFGAILESVRSLFNTILTPSTTCKPLDLTFNIRGNDVNILLPCGYNFWHNSNVIGFKVIIDLVINGLFSYVIFLKFYHELLKLADPNYAPTNTEVMEL